jgi:hypothetical protein
MLGVDSETFTRNMTKALGATNTPRPSNRHRYWENDMAPVSLIGAERVRELLDYDHLSGIFTWRDRPRVHGNRKGRVAGTRNLHGYIRIRIDQREYPAHHLAFLWMTGSHPPTGMVVDHINGCRADNSWLNLRVITFQENIQNRASANKNARSKYLGVSFYERDGCWRARIYVNGKEKWLGNFSTEQDAHGAYVSAKLALHRGAVADRFQNLA